MTKKQLIITRGTYIAPECNALEIKSQGMVCQSLDNVAINDWGTPGEEFPLTF